MQIKQGLPRAVSHPSMSLSTLRSPSPEDMTLPEEDRLTILLKLGKPETKDEKTIRSQACRLLQVAKLVYTDPVIKHQSIRIAELQAQNARLQVSLATKRAALENYTVLTLGPVAVLIAIKLYANHYYGLTCHCRHCCETFGEVEERVRKGRCLIFPELIQMLRDCDLTFGFMHYYKGNPVEFHPDQPEDFPPARSLFSPETLSHVDSHIVFEQMGNSYVFKFGKPLHFVDSPYHPEGFKLLELVKRLRIKAMDT